MSDGGALNAASSYSGVVETGVLCTSRGVIIDMIVYLEGAHDATTTKTSLAIRSSIVA